MGFASGDSLDRLGRRQYGMVSTAQLRALGCGRDEIHRLVDVGRIVPFRLGVYRLCGVEPTWYGAAMAAVLAAGCVPPSPAAGVPPSPAGARTAGVALSHRSAAVLWGLLEPDGGSDWRGRLVAPCWSGPSGQPSQAVLEITTPRQHRLEGVRAHRHLLGPEEVVVHRRIPVTTVERTLLDLAGTQTAQEIGLLLDQALRRRLTTPRRMVAFAQRRGRAGRVKRAPLEQALADRGIGYDPGANGWELRMDRMWERMGLPPAERQYRIVVAGGRSYRPDRAIVDARIAVDWNGFGTHGTRSGFDADSDRRARLAAAGWLPLDFTSRSSPALICRTVLAVYRQRTGATTLPAS